MAAIGLTLFTLTAIANSDPPGCTATGVGLSMTVFRSDGTTSAATSGDETVESGETINYQATLSYLGGANCNFEGGTLTIPSCTYA
jgi:hypothetical protein